MWLRHAMSPVSMLSVTVYWVLQRRMSEKGGIGFGAVSKLVGVSLVTVCLSLYFCDINCKKSLI